MLVYLVTTDDPANRLQYNDSQHVGGLRASLEALISLEYLRAYEEK